MDKNRPLFKLLVAMLLTFFKFCHAVWLWFTVTGLEIVFVCNTM